MDKDGRGVIACDYTYTGQPMDTREAGIRLLLKGACDTVKWRRWSEWGVFPQESISRTEGTASRAPRPEVGRGPLERAPGLAVVAGRNRAGHRRLPLHQIQHLRSGAGLAGRLGTQRAMPTATPISARRWRPAAWPRTCFGAVRWARCRSSPTTASRASSWCA